MCNKVLELALVSVLRLSCDLWEIIKDGVLTMCGMFDI